MLFRKTTFISKTYTLNLVGFSFLFFCPSPWAIDICGEYTARLKVDRLLMNSGGSWGRTLRDEHRGVWGVLSEIWYNFMSF